MTPALNPNQINPIGREQVSCNGTLSAALKRSEDTQLNLYFDKIVQVQSQLIEKGSSYSNVVVTLIYAGSFLLIGSLSDTISQADLRLAGLLLMMSLIAYACWTVSLSYQNSKWNIKLSSLLANPSKSVARKLAELEVLERKQAASLVKHFSIWLWVFQFCLIPGFLGAFYLLTIFFGKVVGLGFSPAAAISRFLLG